MIRPPLKHLALVLSLAALIIGSAFPALKLNDVEKNRLKGNVKSMMEIKYAIPEDGDSNSREKIVYQKFTVFDENGYETESTLFKNGTEFLISRLTYVNDSTPIELNEYHPDGTLNLKVTYKYDDRGFRTEAGYEWAENRQIGEITDLSDYYYEIIQNDLFNKVHYKNEYRGYCIQEDYLKPDSSLSFRFTMKYDFRGNKLESAYFHGNERLSWISKYKYDRYDNMIESRVYKSNRIAVESSYKYRFDLIGNWVYRYENRKVYVNILTAGLDRENTVTERQIEYY